MMDVNSYSFPVLRDGREATQKESVLIKQVADQAGVEIILAFKAFAMWKSFSDIP